MLSSKYPSGIFRCFPHMTLVGGTHPLGGLNLDCIAFSLTESDVSSSALTQPRSSSYAAVLSILCCCYVSSVGSGLGSALTVAATTEEAEERATSSPCPACLLVVTSFSLLCSVFGIVGLVLFFLNAWKRLNCLFHILYQTGPLSPHSRTAKDDVNDNQWTQQPLTNKHLYYTNLKKKKMLYLFIYFFDLQ